MRSRVLLLVTMLLILTIPQFVSAGLLKAYVTEFAVTGPANKEELRTALQGLLASRLNPDQVQLVDDRADADLVLSGSYARFGGMFSIDLLLKGRDGKILRKVFEQGEGENDLIPALGRLSRKIDTELAKTKLTASTTPLPSPPPAPAVTVPAAPALSGAEKFRIVPETRAKGAPAGWTSPPQEGVFVGMAVGRKLLSGEREIFLAGERTVHLYHQGAELKQIAAVELDAPAKVLGIDTADLDGDGVPELYVTVMDRETLASRVYLPREGKLEQLADNLPYFFRGMEQGNDRRTILVQGMGMGGEFYGDVAELVRTGTTFGTRNPQKLPRFGNLYNFNVLTDAAGKRCYVLLNADGYLVVTSRDGRQLWQSSDKFGGTERHYKRETLEEKRYSTDQYRWFYLEQRLTVTPEGELLVPRNDGIFVVGNLRAYKKHSLYALRWTGAILEERWHTRESPTYLADYAYDPGTRELLQLEITQKESLLGKGQSVISVNAIEHGVR